MTSTVLEPPADLRVELASADAAAQVLAFARAEKQAAQRAEANVLAAAVAWAELHSPESVEDAACWAAPAGEHVVEIAGPGAPQVAEFAVPEFALALGLSTDSGRHLIGQALELCWRLPRHWARVQAGDLAPWRARRLAEQTMTLSVEGAAWVDAQLAPFLHKSSFAAQERLVTEAITRFEPARARAEAEAAEDRRGVKISHEHLTFWGTSRIEGELDLADAFDLEAVLQAGAAQQAALGSTESLDVRRAKALGALARGELTLHPEDTDQVRATGRSVVLYVHLSEAALRSPATDCATEEQLHLARVENAGQVITADQVRHWCGRPDTRVTVKPVIDLADHMHVDAYEVPDRLAEQTALRDHTCAFPWCTRTAKKCDGDHVVPHSRGAPTCSCNLAPLCRRHHRLKTHATWSYVPLEPGSYLWTSPHGYTYLVDHTGTADMTPTQHRGRPLPPHTQQP